MSHCRARWNITWQWTRKKNLLLNCQSPISCAVPNSQGHILAIYATEGCRQSPATAFAQPEEQLLFLLASHGWGSETSPALLQMILQQLLLRGAGGCEIPADDVGAFLVWSYAQDETPEVVPRSSSFLSSISFCFFPFQLLLPFPLYFFLMGLLIFT